MAWLLAESSVEFQTVANGAWAINTGEPVDAAAGALTCTDLSAVGEIELLAARTGEATSSAAKTERIYQRDI
jgi:hypothetical protein